MVNPRDLAGNAEEEEECIYRPINVGKLSSTRAGYIEYIQEYKQS